MKKIIYAIAALVLSASAVRANDQDPAGKAADVRQKSGYAACTSDGHNWYDCVIAGDGYSDCTADGHNWYDCIGL